MKRYSIQIIIFVFLIAGSILKAQVVAEPSETILCDGQQGEVGVTLTATSYAVDLTDSNIYTDDIFGSVIDMGFNFQFYENTYSEVVLASNKLALVKLAPVKLAPDKSALVKLALVK